jgi:hypothetical protein
LIEDQKVSNYSRVSHIWDSVCKTCYLFKYIIKSHIALQTYIWYQITQNYKYLNAIDLKIFKEYQKSLKVVFEKFVEKFLKSNIQRISTLKISGRKFLKKLKFIFWNRDPKKVN